MHGDRRPPEFVSSWVPESVELRSRLGIAAVLDGNEPGELAQALASDVPMDPGAGAAEIVGTILLNDSTTGEYTTVIERHADGSLRARCVPGAHSRIEDDETPSRIDEAAWAAAVHTPAHSVDPRVALDATLYPPGEVVALPPPYTPSPFIMDREGLAGRLNGGSSTTIKPMDRDLAAERLFLRAPIVPVAPGDDADRPSPARGLLLWVPAAAEGEPPETLFEAADTLNLVIVSASNCGNDRDVSNRLQLCLDAIATVAARIPIDRDRVYVTGISGGGRISSMLHICFPDLFTGSVPIVGVNYYGTLPAGDGKVWPQSMVRPSAKRWALLKTQRLAPISGPPDFNFQQTRITVDRFRLDGLDARFFSFDDQAHHMPTPARFREALAWVEDATRARRDRAEQEADRLVAVVEKALGERGAGRLTDSMCKRLDRACQIAPWSEVSERAARLMGLSTP